MNQTTPTSQEQFLLATVLCGCGLMKIPEPEITASERLMPYGEVAKAIFIKANGLPAYNKAYRCENVYCPEEYEQVPA